MNENTPQFEQTDLTPTSQRPRISEVLDGETSPAQAAFRKARETAEGSTKNLAATRRELRRSFKR